MIKFSNDNLKDSQKETLTTWYKGLTLKQQNYVDLISKDYFVQGIAANNEIDEILEDL